MEIPQVGQEPKAWLYQPEQPGLLRLSGKDQLAFIQRQTTNNIDLLAEGKGLVSVLTSPLARILDVFFLFRDNVEGEPVVNLITLPGRGQVTWRFLKSRIFFNDQVKLEDASASTRQFWLDGGFSADLLRKAIIGDLPPTDGMLKTSLAGHGVVLIGRRGLNGTGYLLLVPEKAAKEVESTLAQSGTITLTPDEYETMRIESGLPGPKNELTEEHTPFEVGLGYAVSGNKGCYTGQEVLARQVTYDKITRQMVGLKLEMPVRPGMQVLADGKPAGEITSAAVSPRYGPIALAVLKRPFYDAGIALQVKAAEVLIPALTCTLPFS